MTSTFNIRLWFALAGFVTLAIIWAACAWWFTDFMTRSLMEREAEVSQEFLQSLLDVEGSDFFSLETENPKAAPQLKEFSNHVAHTPGIMRANIYSPGARVLWSTEAQMVGKSFPDNDEVEDAMKGKRITEINSLEHHKSEYLAFGEKGLFIEAYLPLKAKSSDNRVVGVVELYKYPTELNRTISVGRNIIWLSGLGAAILAWATLYWIVQRGARVIETQQRQMRDMQSSALVGELASAVAHSLRNPMAAIRSSAELWRSESAPGKATGADEVIGEVDRMDEYVRDLLAYARADARPSSRVDPAAVLDAVIARRAAALRRNQVEAKMDDARSSPSFVNADPALLEHALTSIVTNAIEAMPSGGVLETRIRDDVTGGNVLVEIRDTGGGIAPELIDQVTQSWFTTKEKGLGLGLSLARGVIERWGGSIAIRSSRESGTTVAVSLKKA